MDPFGVGGAADEVADFGPEAGGGGGRLLSIVVAARAEGEHALERLLGPQEAALVDGQGTGVVQNDTSVLKTAGKKTNKKMKNVLCIAASFFFSYPFLFIFFFLKLFIVLSLWRTEHYHFSFFHMSRR